MAYASGKFGAGLVDAYIDKLKGFSRLRVPSEAFHFFKQSLLAMSDSWRRFVLPTGGFPWLIFNLVGLSQEEFLLEYRRQRDMMLKCRECTDLEFSHVLLNFINLELGESSCDVQAKVKSIQHLLFDISVHAPLTSDLVECLHGFTQALLHRWRGSKPTEPVAQERLVWSLITRTYGKVRDWLWSRIGDSQAKKRLRKYGQSSRNQYSHHKDKDVANKPRPERKLSFERMDRLITFGQKIGHGMKPRKLSGDLPAFVKWRRTGMPCFGRVDKSSPGKNMSQDMMILI